MPLSPANVKIMTMLDGLGMKQICEMTPDEARAAEAGLTALSPPGPEVASVVGAPA